MTVTEMENLEKRLDGRYVKQSACNQNHREIASKLANDDKRIEIGLAKLGVVEKLMWTIATATIGTLIATVFGIIFK